MKITTLTNEETIKTGFTHKAVISYAQSDFSAATTTQTYTLAPITAGMKIGNAGLRLVTVVAGGAIASAAVTVGKTGTTNAYVTSTDVFTGSTVVFQAGNGASFNQAGGDGFASSSSLVAVITTTTGNVSAATGGEFHIYWNQSDPTKL